MTIRLRAFLTGALTAALAGSTVLTLHGRQEGNSSSSPSGRPVYDKSCSRCHGSEGRGDKAPSLLPFRWTYTQALDIVRHGGSCGMPAFPESELSDDEVHQLVDYLKTVKE